MAEQLKLHYFNGRGRAEIIRYILCLAKVDFEDYRIEFADWPSVKQNYPNLQVPVLEINKDGKKHMLAHGTVIARFLAKRHNLVGENIYEEARCDEVVASLMEIHNAGGPLTREQDLAIKEKGIKKLKDNDIPRLLANLEKQLVQNGGKHMVGNSWTWADLHVATLFEGMIKRLGADIEAMVQQQFPNLVKLQKSVEAIPEIAAHIKARPVTSI